MMHGELLQLKYQDWRPLHHVEAHLIIRALFGSSPVLSNRNILGYA
jgi:hypothetical protein